MAESIIQKKSFAFALAIVRLYRAAATRQEYAISKQLLRSGTCIGANVEEASAGISRKNFRAKMSIALKEAKETRFWLRLLSESKIVEIDVRNELGDVDEL